MRVHNFGEKNEEYLAKAGGNVPVIKAPKFFLAKKKAEEIIDSGRYGVEDGDFWILMNATKSNKMMYSGLILSHNGCLKINDSQEASLRFKPSCVREDKCGYRDSLVFTYVNDEQGIYEVGEASATNCKNEYPYAMAYKRLFDRVVLKLSKLAFAGIYSDSESDEFKENDEHKLSGANGAQSAASKPQRRNTAREQQASPVKDSADLGDDAPFNPDELKATDEQKRYIVDTYGDRLSEYLTYAKIASLDELTYAKATSTIATLKKRQAARETA